MSNYTNALSNIDATSRTVGTASRSINARNFVSIWFGLVVLVLLTIVTLFLVKKYLKNEAGNLWDFLSKPYKDLLTRLKAAKSIEETGVHPTIKTKQDAKDVADSIYNCFHAWRDDEESLYNILRTRIANAADWEAVRGQFGVRVCPKPGSLVNIQHYGDLEHIISDNLTPKERTYVRNLLASKGIQTTQI